MGKRFRAHYHCSVCAVWYSDWQRRRAIEHAQVSRLIAGGEHLIDHAYTETTDRPAIQPYNEQDLVDDHLGRINHRVGNDQ